MTEIWRFNVAVTDADWFGQLSGRPDLDEVNFWQPSPSGVRDVPGTPWLFKLHSPQNYIVGGGFFTYYTELPIGVAWEAFGFGNGSQSFEEMLERVSRYKKIAPRDVDEVGCVILGQPFFFEKSAWIPVPKSWKPNIVKGRHYALTEPEGLALWREVTMRLSTVQTAASPILGSAQTPAVGKPLIIIPRLGQGSFRTAVLDAYSRRCAVTGERTLPALEAAHIKPFKFVQTHSVDNGLSLRSDLHHLFDQGYVSVRPDLTFVVSKQIREEFENGRDYYALNGRTLQLPVAPANHPNQQYLDWHYTERFKK